MLKYNSLYNQIIIHSWMALFRNVLKAGLVSSLLLFPVQSVDSGDVTNKDSKVGRVAKYLQNNVKPKIVEYKGSKYTIYRQDIGKLKTIFSNYSHAVVRLVEYSNSKKRIDVTGVIQDDYCLNSDEHSFTSFTVSDGNRGKHYDGIPEGLKIYEHKIETMFRFPFIRRSMKLSSRKNYSYMTDKGEIRESKGFDLGFPHNDLFHSGIELVVKQIETEEGK